MAVTMKLRKLGLVAGAILGLGFAAPGYAVTTQLGLLVDGSGSIGTSNFNIFKTGIAAALGQINTNGTVEVTVIQFSSGAAVVQAPLLINSAGDRTTVVNAVNAMVYQNGGSTNYQAAYNLMASTMNFHVGDANYMQFINMATDGGPNAGNTNAGLSALVAAGADLISYEGVGLNASTTSLLRSLSYPNPPGVIAPPFPSPIYSQGFVVNVANFGDIEGALLAKFQAGGIITAPEPGSLALLGLGLLGLGLMRRKAA